MRLLASTGRRVVVLVAARRYRFEGDKNERIDPLQKEQKKLTRYWQERHPGVFSTRVASEEEDEEDEDKFDPASIALLLVPAVSLAWGIIEWRKRNAKLELLGLYNEITWSLPPIELPRNASELTNGRNPYRKVKLSGKFDHSREIFVEAQRLSIDDDVTGSKTGAFGCCVITPFFIKGGKAEVLVNQGLLPASLRMKQRRDDEPGGNVEIVAVNRPNEPPISYRRPNEPEENKWNQFDTQQMSAALQTQPILFDAITRTSSSISPSPSPPSISVSVHEANAFLGVGFALSALVFYILALTQFGFIRAARKSLSIKFPALARSIAKSNREVKKRKKNPR